MYDFDEKICLEISGNHRNKVLHYLKNRAEMYKIYVHRDYFKDEEIITIKPWGKSGSRMRYGLYQDLDRYSFLALKKMMKYQGKRIIKIVLKPEIVMGLYLNYGLKMRRLDLALIEYLKQIFKKDVCIERSWSLSYQAIHENLYICTETNTLEKIEKQYIEIL
ncbi:MAG: hypothetical protein ACI4V7_06515 [Succinivibrionaceae bacterium]